MASDIALVGHDADPVLIDRAAEGRSLLANLAAVFAYRELIRNLVLKDLKLKYRGSALGFAWSLVNPLAMVGVYTLAFKFILGVRQPGFPFFVLLGLLAWTFFSNAAVMSTGSLIDGGSLVKAVRFPRAVLPVATVLFNLVQYLLTVVALLPVIFITYRVPHLGGLLLFPVFVALQAELCIGLGLILSAATTYFRDVRHFIEIGLQLGFWITPIVYPLTQAPDAVRGILFLSPMTPFVVAYQQLFYDGSWPGVTIWLAAIGYGLGALAIGGQWFFSIEDRLGEQLG